MKKYQLSYYPAAVILLLLLGSAATSAQKIFSATPIIATAAESAALQQVFKKQTLVQLNAASLYAFVKQAGKQCNFIIDVTGRYRWDIHLEQHDLRSGDYIAQRTTDKGVITMQRSECITWAGSLKGGITDAVRLNIQAKKLSGYIIYQGKQLYIEPLSNFFAAAPADKYVIYERGDSRPTNGTCGVTATAEQQVNEKLSTLNNTILAADCRKIEIATESDWEAHDEGLSSSDILGNLNLVEPLFLGYYFAGIVVKYQHEWTTAADPYTDDEVCGRLNELGDYWNSNYAWVKRDIAILYTRSSLSGSGIGCAWTGEFDDTDGDCYLVAQWDYTFSNNSGRQVLVAHEMGHVLGSSHDESGCGGLEGPIMCPIINNSCTGNCTPYWSDASITSITAGMASAVGSGHLRNREFFMEVNTSVRLGGPVSFSGNELVLTQHNVVGDGILGKGSIVFTGTDKVSLMPGFSASVLSGAGFFSAKTGLCDPGAEFHSGNPQQTVAAARLDSIKHTTSIKVYPNPFANNTNVAITLEAAAQVSVHVYSMQGKLIDNPVKNKAMPAGINNVTYANSRLTAGIYLIVVEINGRRFTQKLVKQ